MIINSHVPPEVQPVVPKKEPAPKKPVAAKKPAVKKDAK